MEEGGPFRFIITGYYKSITINQNQVNINDSHYLNGAIFEIRDDRILDQKGQCMVWDNNRVCLSSDSTHKIILDPINHGLFFMMYNDCYIDDNLNLQEDEDDAMIVQLAEVDNLNDLQPYIITNFDNTPISADGIPLTEDYMFCLSICGEQADARDFEGNDNGKNKLNFGSNPCTQGIPFKLIQHEGHILFKSIDGDNYLGIDEEYGGYSFYFTDDIPNHPISIVPTRYDTIFILSDGNYYYKVEFYKCSYGEMVRVDKKKHATRFQFISVKYLDN